MNLKTKLVPVTLVVLACLLVCCGPLRAYDWLPPTNKVVLLAIWAHPDDEAIFGGGSLPYYSSVLRLPTMLLCLADGNDVVRQKELRSAAWTYGLRYEPMFGHFNNLNTRVMTNCPYTNTIDACWDLWADGVLQGNGTDVEAGKARAINFLAEQIRWCRPDVIITHDLNGESEHDNHRATAYAVTQAFFLAADPNATADNLVGLPPWQAKKLYVHLYPTNRLFHEFWETPYPALTNHTPHQAANIGLTCNVSQGPQRWVGASVYPPKGMYNQFPSEWWGLYASKVGPDVVLGSNTVLNGYTVPAGVAAGDFLQHLNIPTVASPPPQHQPLAFPAR
jgi:LmbE family N-acetylglucosaminyl deacetylase